MHPVEYGSTIKTTDWEGFIILAELLLSRLLSRLLLLLTLVVELFFVLLYTIFSFCRCDARIDCVPVVSIFEVTILREGSRIRATFVSKHTRGVCKK